MPLGTILKSSRCYCLLTKLHCRFKSCRPI